MRLIEIEADGRPGLSLRMSEVAQSVCEANAGTYERTGFERPWIGCLAEADGVWLGTCAFTSAPRDPQVEIAYFTFPEFEGRGIATGMASALLDIARAAHPQATLTITALTLPTENASVSILRKLGFEQRGTQIDADAGTVWCWELAKPSG